MAVSNWRSIAKSTIKTGIRGGAIVRAGASRAAENLADVAQEAVWETGVQPAAAAPVAEQAADAAPSGGRRRRASNSNGDVTAVARESATLT